MLIAIAFSGQNAGPVFAQSAEETPSKASEATSNPAGKFVQDMGDKAVEILKDQNKTPEQRTEEYYKILHDNFDLPTIGRFVLGRSWRAASPEQQKEYMELFEELIVKMYGDRLLSYKGEKLQVTGVRQENDRDSVVLSQITHPNKPRPTRVEWRVRNKDGKLGVIDVIIEGVSQSISQREEYAAVIHRDGGKLDGLLDQMRAQIGSADAPKT